MPGASRPLDRMSSGGMSSTPTSEASTTSPLRVTTQRAGRRPFRSRMDPTVIPSLNEMAGRAVPRLHDGRVVLVEGALVLAHVVARAEGLRHHHHERVLAGTGRRQTSSSSTLSKMPESLRLGLDHRGELRDVVSEKRRGHGRSRAFILLMFPRSVLISPLCAM